MNAVHSFPLFKHLQSNQKTQGLLVIIHANTRDVLMTECKRGGWNQRGHAVLTIQLLVEVTCSNSLSELTSLWKHTSKCSWLVAPTITDGRTQYESRMFSEAG